MKNQEFNEDLISYLYGDMSTEECLAFEQKMNQDPALKAEYIALAKVRKELVNMSEKESQVPFYPSFAKGYYLTKTSNWSGIFIRSILAVAASLTILLIAGYLTDFHLIVNEGKMSVGFQEIPTEKILSEQEIRGFMQQELSKNNLELLAQSKTIKEDTDTRLASLEKSVTVINQKASKSLVTKEDLEEFFTLVETRNTETLKEYMAAATSQQQQYLKALLTEYNSYLQQQREDDLTAIRTGFIEMKQNQTQQKLATDQVLASLISTVSNK